MTELTVDERLEKVKALVIKSFSYLKAMESRLTELEEANRELSEQIEAVGSDTHSTKKFRNIRARPEAIAFARYLLDKEDFTLQEVEDSGALSYNRAYGLSQWSQKHFDDFATNKGVTDHYVQGDSHPDFDKYVTEFAPKHGE